MVMLVEAHLVLEYTETNNNTTILSESKFRIKYEARAERFILLQHHRQSPHK